MTMDKPINKSNESTISTTGTTGTPPFSDTIDNNVKYMNLNFIDNSESSSQAKDAPLDFSKLQNAYFEAQKVSKPAKSKILPSNLPFPGAKLDLQKQKQEPSLKEKTLAEMGFRANEIVGWENIVQPPKESLYKLLKNMIDNHIKPNVQIRIGGVTFNCHMMVLQCYSDFFMECTNEVLIQLPEEKITPGAFMMVYDWMLAEEPLVQREGILELFNAANFLRIKNLVNQCWLCLDDDIRFREDTAFLLYLEARNYGLESLEQLMLTRICKFFLTLVSSKEFLQLTAKEICTLLSSNTIGVNSEIEIFMSVVRWLTHNYEEREADMLNVIKCVRFSLMPPWFLVTLNKSTDCTEIDRIVSHPEVKKMINDGISFTTTQLYYGENREEFLHFLERYQLLAPTQRQWVFDKECSYHHRLECPNMQYVTYKSFLEYLEMIHTIGKDYWKTLEMAKGVEKTMQCCVRSDCRKSTDQNLATVFTKNSRDQGVQVEEINFARQRKDYIKATDFRELINIDEKTNTTVDKISKNRTRRAFRPAAPSAVLSCCHRQEHEVEKVNQNKQHRLYQRHRGDTKRDTIKIRETKDPFQNNSYDDHPHECQHKGPYNGKQHTAFGKEDTDYETLMDSAMSKKYKNLHLNSSPTGITEAVGNFKSETMNINCNHVDESNAPQRMKLPVKSSVTSVTALDFNLVRTKKLLVFGGIDPYGQHCWHDGTQSSHRQQHHCHQHQYQRGRVIGTDDGQEVNAENELENYGDQVLFYDAFDNLWKHLSYIPFGSRHHHAAVACNELIYVIGGTRSALGCTNKSIFEKSIWSFDSRLLKWTLESTIPESRRDFAVVPIDEKSCNLNECMKIGTGFFIIGGEGIAGEALDSVWFYDILLKSWKRKASLNVGRYGLAAVLINNNIWIAGGIINEVTKTCDSGDALGYGEGMISATELITDTVEYYSLQSSEDTEMEVGNETMWILSKKRLRIPRLFARFCKVSQNQIYLIGGIGVTASNTFASLSSIDRFDHQDEKWSHCGDLEWARHGHDVASLNDKIIIIGGVSTYDKSTLSKVETFCTKAENIIDDVADLPWPLSGCAAVAL